MSNWPLPTELRDMIYEHLFYEPPTYIPYSEKNGDDCRVYLKFGISTDIFRVNKAMKLEALRVFNKSRFAILTIPEGRYRGKVRELIPSKLITSEQKKNVSFPLEIILSNERNQWYYPRDTPDAINTLVFDVRYLDRLVDALNGFRASDIFFLDSVRQWSIFSKMEIRLSNSYQHNSIITYLERLRMGQSIDDTIGGLELEISPLSKWEEVYKKKLPDLEATIRQPRLAEDSFLKFSTRLQRKAEDFFAKGELLAARSYYLIAFTCAEATTVDPQIQCSHIEESLGLNEEALEHAEAAIEQSEELNLPVPFEELMAIVRLIRKCYGMGAEDTMVLAALEAAWQMYSGPDHEDDREWIKAQFDSIVDRCSDDPDWELADAEEFAPNLIRTIVTPLKSWIERDQMTEASSVQFEDPMEWQEEYVEDEERERKRGFVKRGKVIPRNV